MRLPPDVDTDPYARREAAPYTARVTRLFARLNLSPPLRSITLAQVLAGDTCAPIALSDFEAYLAFYEHSLENLHFLAWAQAHRARFFALPAAVRARSPRPGCMPGADADPAGEQDFAFGAPSPVRTDARARESRVWRERLRAPAVPVTVPGDMDNDGDADADADADGPHRPPRIRTDLSPPVSPRADPASGSNSNSGSGSGSGTLHSPFSPLSTVLSSRSSTSGTASASATVGSRASTSSAFGLLRPAGAPASPPPALHLGTSSKNTHAHAHLLAPEHDGADGDGDGDIDIDPATQPLRRACARAVATFLRPGAREELSLDAATRDAVVRELAWSTHPDVFLPAYEEAYALLETESLPRFLVHSSTMINLPKQIVWFTLGLCELVAGVVLAAVLTTQVCTPPAARRAWRLFALLPLALGIMHCFAASRGMCTFVGGRGNVQLRVWELQDPEADAELALDRATGSPFADAPVALAALRGAGNGNENGHFGSDADGESADGHAYPDKLTLTLTSPAQRALIAPFDFDAAFAADAKSPFAPLPLPSASASPLSASPPPSSPPPPSSSPPSSSPRARTRTHAPGLARTYPYRRPPIFGPERLVLDPRVRAVHAAAVRAIFAAGALGALLCGAVVLGVPGCRSAG